MPKGNNRDTLADGNLPSTQEAWERRARLLLDEGQNFLVHDTCREGLKLYPDSHKLAIYGATALSQTGADEEARRLLKPVLDALLVDDSPLRRLETSLRRAVDRAGGGNEESLAAMVDLAEAMELVRGRRTAVTVDAETYGALAQVLRESWLSTGDHYDLDLAGELYLRAFQTGADPRDGVNAASLMWFQGKTAEAAHLATQVVEQLMDWGGDPNLPADVLYERLATWGLAELLLGHGDDAVSSFHSAAALEGTSYPPVVALLKQLEQFRTHGIAVPDEVTDLIRPPQVVVFTGHALDRPDEAPRFPPQLEAEVRAEIVQVLDEIDARVGFSMASCGSELLFIEAMLERGGEVNIVLPFALDDFIAANVRYGGARWEMRFRNALRLASSVTFATEEHFLGHEMLYRFANQCLSGLATLRAGFLCSNPTLIAVWDMMPGSLVGGAADFIDSWEDISRLRLIDLDGLLQQHPELMEEGQMPNFDLGDGDSEEGQGRVIRSMMFCDIAGYSKLAEEYVPVYLEFLQMLKDGLVSSGVEPQSINTWGDAIFVVMEKASPLAEYALTLQEAVIRASDTLKGKLPHALSLRISLHAGPVFEAIDPICNRINFYGSHINRAARLEPVTVIGHVYATQQFVAVLTAEQSAMRTEAGGAEFFEEKFVCEYVGQLSLAKDFGRQVVYHLRRKVLGAAALPGEDAVIDEAVPDAADVSEPPAIVLDAEPDVEPVLEDEPAEIPVDVEEPLPLAIPVPRIDVNAPLDDDTIAKLLTEEG